MLTQQSKPNRWSCMATAFAMALDMPIATLLGLIGHDGSEIVCVAQEPDGRRGFSAQECIEVAVSRGIACTQIELFPGLIFSDGQRKFIRFPHSAIDDAGNWERFQRHIATSRGVISGNVESRRSGHAVAYENGLIYDPDGFIYPFTQGACEERHFYCQMLWRLDRINP